MIYILFFTYLFNLNVIFAQNNPAPSYNYSDDYYQDDYYQDGYDGIQTNYYDEYNNLIGDTNTNNTEILTPAEEFTKKLHSLVSNKTLNLDQLKTKKFPTLFSSEGMLKNIDSSHWLLKYYSHPNANLYKYIQISFENSSINIQVIDYAEKIIDDSTYHLTPISMLKPNEGIFAYTDSKGNIFFIYLHLLLTNILVVEMTSTFEEAEQATHKSLTNLGIFILN